MGTEVETKMTEHLATHFWGGDDKGVCIQITASKPMKLCYTINEQIQQEGFVQLTMEEAAELCSVLNDFICEEARRRKDLLRDELKRIQLSTDTVFHEVMNLHDDIFKVPNLAVLMVSKFCPKVRIDVIEDA